MRNNFNWMHYLEVAQLYVSDLDAQQDVLAEAKQRCYISRAYYSLFIRTRNYLVKKYNERDLLEKDRERDPAKRKGSHERVFLSCSKKKDATLREIGANLFNLFNLRKMADYEDYMDPWIYGFSQPLISELDNKLIELYKRLS